jgi:NAD(P)H-hydrate repair Nnr-like enzyme with NAD(P)H-hydrate dehydratase domain
MREMSETDLDALANELGVDAGAGKVGLLVPEGASNDVSEVEVEGVKGTAEKVDNSDLELEKKLAEVEIGGKLPEDEDEAGAGEVAVKGLSKLEDMVVGADKEEGGLAATNKEKQD